MLAVKNLWERNKIGPKHIYNSHYGNDYLLVLSSWKVNIAKKTHCRNGIVDTFETGQTNNFYATGMYKFVWFSAGKNFDELCELGLLVKKYNFDRQLSEMN